MNRAKGQLDKRVNKKRDKAVKYGQNGYYVKPQLPLSDAIHPEDILKQQPKKIAKKDAEALRSAMKRMALKKKHSAHSKRTTPGEVDERPSAPASVHPEGRRWQKTLTLQNKVQRKSLTKKLSKKR